MAEHFIYLIASETSRRTYIGYTKNIERRLRQHNGEIVGGAKATHYGRPWKYICIISGFKDKKTALQFEWRCHHPYKKLINRKISPIRRRLNVIYEIFQKDKPTLTCLSLCQFDLKLTFYDDDILNYWLSLST